MNRGGVEGESMIDTETLGVPTTAEMLRDIVIGQEGFISTKRLLWMAGIALTWMGSSVVAYKYFEMLSIGDDTGGPLRVALSLPVAFAVTIAVDALFLDRLIHPRRTPSI